MIRKLLTILIVTASMLLPSGCTHNNGDIGPWFGQWKMTRMDIDGVADAEYQGNIYWSFQTNIFQMKKITPGVVNHADTRWGTWSEEGDCLLLNFTYSSALTPPGSGVYTPLPETYIPADQVSRLEILKRPGDSMELSFTTPQGKQITYYLIKW